MVITKFFKNILSSPWMSLWEFELIKEILIFVKPKNCFEWGTGGSTLIFTKYIPKESKWIACEHNRIWYIRIKYQLSLIKLFRYKRNIKLFYVPPNNYPWTDKNYDGAYSDLTDYIEFPNKFNLFDFVLVDGRARKECLLKAYKILKKKGVVVLHDANRKYYHKPLSLYKYRIFLSNPLEKEKGLWFGSKGFNIVSWLYKNKNINKNWIH